MKLFKILLGLVLVAGISSGCKKALDQQPLTSFSDQLVFSSADKIDLALNGVYDAAQSGFYINTDNSNTVRGYPFGSANIEQGDARGEDILNIAAFYEVTYQSAYTPVTPNNVNFWSNLYFLINKANIFIEGVRKAGQSGIITSTKADQYVGEALFLRAMAHHEAVIYFARPYRDGNGSKLGIPYRDFPINSANAVNEARKTPRISVDSVYKKILADLDQAESFLPSTRSTIRATKAAAIALKMRVKLHKGDWAGVITEGNKIVPATAPFVSAIGGYTLTAASDGPFTDNSSLENIFSIRNDALDNPSTNGALSSMYGPVATAAATLGARGLLAVSPIIWNNSGWLCDDKRRALLYVPGVNANTAGTINNVFPIKYRSYVDRADFAPQIRYAEVLLTLAEAEARQATVVSQRALDLLNAVRNRALATPATQAYTIAGFANKNALVAAILLERRIELLAEGKRWGDIHRNAVDPDFSAGGIPAKVTSRSAGMSLYGCGVAVTTGQAAIPYSDYRFIWPIPTEEINQNPIIEKNPGY